MEPIHPETASGLIQDRLMSESNNNSLQRALTSIENLSICFCLFVVGPDWKWAPSNNHTMQEKMDGVCVCV
jgi:hypothetical protein